MNFVGQLAEVFLDKTIAISADDKNKVNVGTYWLSVGIFLLRLYLPQTINLTTPIMILLVPMLKLFQLDTYYLVHEIGDQEVFCQGT